METNRTCLILFTDFYPFGISSENGFLDSEIDCLSRKFDAVIIVPRLCAEEFDKVGVILADNVIVEPGLIAYLQHRKRILGFLWMAIRSNLFHRELMLLAKSKGGLFHRIEIALGAFAYSVVISEWLEGFIAQYQIDIKNAIFYTYWFSKATIGIGLLKKKHEGLFMVSRAHRFDLYADCQQESYFPYRSAVLYLLNELHLVSEHGLTYMEDVYPEYKGKYRLSRLGVTNPGFVANASTDGVFRLVSCSYVKDVKRLDLLIDGLIALARLCPNRHFRWDHFGDGPLFDQIRDLAKRLPPNIDSLFWGRIPNWKIIKYYRDNPVDIFLNVSKSEGIPVSIMEAQSCGIPVIATAVGGTPEIVNAGNGCLLKADPTANEIAESIWSMLSNSEELYKKKRDSIDMWQTHYDASINFENFSDHLLHLLPLL